MYDLQFFCLRDNLLVPHHKHEAVAFLVKVKIVFVVNDMIFVHNTHRGSMETYGNSLEQDLEPPP